MENKEHVHTGTHKMTADEIVEYMKMSKVDRFERRAGNVLITCDKVDFCDCCEMDEPNYILQMTEFRELYDGEECSVYVEYYRAFIELVYDNDLKPMRCSFHFEESDDVDYVKVDNSELSDDVNYVEGATVDFFSQFYNNQMAK